MRIPIVTGKKNLRIKTFGHSMYPLLHDQDVVHLKPISFSRIKVNDILCMTKGKKMFTHRVIYKTDTYLISKGDNTHTSDGRIYPRNIIGKVSAITRNNEKMDVEDLYLFQSTLYYNEIQSINSYFQQLNIDYVILKGLPLHMYITGGHPRRVFADCDILVRSSNFNQVKQALEKNGYQQLDTSISKLHSLLKDKHTETSFVKYLYDFPVVFDVHTEAVFLMNQLGKLDPLYPQKLVDELTDELLDSKRCIRLHNKTFPVLSEPQLILYLLLHFFHHNFKGIHRIELASSIITESMWKKTIPLINKYRVNKFVSPGIFLLYKYYRAAFLQRYLKDINFVSNRNSLSAKVFNENDRISEGVEHFKNIFKLSPSPLYKKAFIFLNYQVICSIGWTILRKSGFNRLIHNFV